ncbi:S100P-binding protein [Etheostoma spectabile]|uniref:S100P-binding protein n=1 Tax=Etheostoma spectabile TaxID=54343 RepID=UPI0013AEEB44|nr:S100P-binding protein [Etheostoma spectabile]
MDEKTHSTTNPIFNRLNPAKHFTPLSIYSRMITCEEKDSLDHQTKLSKPFINLKIELVNNRTEKRKLEDDSYQTPAKNAFSPKDVSPDLGCFMDYSSSPATQDSVSPFAISMSALLDKTQADKSKIKESVCSQRGSEQVECCFSTQPGGSKGTAPHSLRCEKDLASAFDCDVEDILCLNPLGTAVGFSQNKPVLTVANGQELKREDGQHLDRGEGQVGEGQEKLKKEMHLHVKEDKGYFSMSYIKDLKMGKNPSQSVYSQVHPATSSSLLRLGAVETPEKGYLRVISEKGDHPECSSKPGCPKQAAQSGQKVSFTVRDLCPILNGPMLKSDNCTVEALEGDVDEAWNIGSPIFESSVVQATPCGAETTLDTSYETTLPLQVQVKSVVVALGQHTSSSKTAATSLPEQTGNPTKLSQDENRSSTSAKCVSARSPRPVIFDREVDWEREKRLYVHSVTRHMKEHRGANPDVMTELLTLMTHVADQASGTDGRQWQHPSDLTCRNYQRRFGNQMPKMTLHEWHARSNKTHKRFAKVPKIFERSQLF